MARAKAGPEKAAYKTAVIVIHGMGEQRPMDTIWGVVKALWTCDPDITERRTDGVYAKPDPTTGSFELRRITTRRVPLEDGLRKRADFFEFYWAHLMTGNSLQSVVKWASSLLIRRPSSVPNRLVFPWLVGLVLLISATMLVALAGAEAWAPGLLKAASLPAIPSWIFLLAAALTSLFGIGAARWLVPVAGDAARYLSPLPDNVEARQKIREAGIDLLNKLHESDQYDRIILVCHSLGCVIGYDILNHAWGRLSSTDLLDRHPQQSAAMDALTALERAAGELRHAAPQEIGQARIRYRAAQRAYHKALAARGPRTAPIWLVSDFVTLGCPLSKADVLLAKNAAEFEDLKRRREAPSSPPWFEKDDRKNKRFRFSYPTDDASRIPHHATVFAPVVWTNVYFDNFLIAFGDIVSGAVAPLFGRGVLDIRLRVGAPRFRHLDYWKNPTTDPPEPWIKALRRAVNLKALDDQTLWGDQSTAEVVEARDLPDRQAPPAPRQPGRLPAAGPGPTAPRSASRPRAGRATRP